MDRYRVPRAIVASTFDKVRECGAGHRECQVLWIGPWDEPMAISEAVHPQHRSHSSGFDVEGDWLNAFWLELAAKKAGVRAQVHTHPGRAFHSATDDKFPIIHVPGFLSLVIPDFGIGPVTFDGVYLAELNRSRRLEERAGNEPIRDRMTLREALDRTLLLMRDHVRADTADDALLEALCSTEVAVVSDAANVASHSAQTAVVTAATLIARMGASIHLDLPTTMCCLQPPLRSLELNEALEDLGRDLLPERNPFQIGTVDREVDIAVIIGSSPWRGRARQGLRLAAEPWTAMMLPADIIAPWQAHAWPFGGLGAGALAAGEAFKAAMRKLQRFSASPIYDETFATTSAARFSFAPSLTPTKSELGRIDLISAGAITHAMLFVLARIPGAAGDLRVVDQEASDVSNLNRYQLLRLSDVGSSKVKHLGRLDLKQIRLRPVETRFDRDTARYLRSLASVVLAGVDHIPSRWAIQREAANWLSIGATSHYSAMASFHRPGLPCAGCLHPRDDVQDGAIPTLAFVSFWAGLMAAAFLMRHLAGDRLSAAEQQIYFTPLRPEGRAWTSAVEFRNDCALHCADACGQQDVRVR